jgi:hypothetical protein
MITDHVKDMAARRSEDAASHGYNGRNGKGADLLRSVAQAVRIASRRVEGLYGVPTITAAERAEYTSELVGRLLGENGGKIPDAKKLGKGYLAKRAQGIILNDRDRRNVAYSEGDHAEPSIGEAGADSRLDGPIMVPAELEAAARRLHLSMAGQRALIAAVVPATREEWAEHYGYSNADSWKTIAKRGRAELREIGQHTLRKALRAAEAATVDRLDIAESALREMVDTMEAI